jgi:A/G-specific adenine glycosylase
VPARIDDPERARRALAAWFEDEKRALPWREPPHSEDPYAVLVSEVMLQQTRVTTVVPYFEDWMERFPTVEVLAEADEDEVLDAWQGLGFYDRARRLHAAARAIVDEHGGRVPEDPGALEQLSGVGPYTAAAVGAVALGPPTPAVDGNVVRVWARLAGEAVDPTRDPVRRRAGDQLAPLVDGEDPGALVEALIELGATVCTPEAPDCPACPLEPWCTARADDRVHEVPDTPDTPDRPTHVVIALLHRTEEGVLLARRPTDGLLGGLWGLPMAEREPGEARQATAERALDGTVARLGERVTRVEHVFSHKEWRVHVHEAELDAPPTGDGWTRRPMGEVDLATSTLDDRVLEALAQTRLERFA